MFSCDSNRLGASATFTRAALALALRHYPELYT